MQADCAMGGDGKEDRVNDSTDAFDEDRFLAELDAIFSSHRGATDAEPCILQALADAENAGDDAGMLTVLNEAIGFYRSQGRHQDVQWTVQRALELGLRMGITGTDAWTTTLINAATGMRAAGLHDQAEDLYKQALESANATLSPTDRRMAALHNNLSMLYSETGRPRQALAELRAALDILESSSPDPDHDVDIAATHANMALILLDVAAQSSESDEYLRQADHHALTALSLYRAAGAEHESHYASALAAMAQVSYARGLFDDAVAFYGKALALIEECYGTDADSYRVTKQNLEDARLRAGKRTPDDTSSPAPPVQSGDDRRRHDDGAADGPDIPHPTDEVPHATSRVHASSAEPAAEPSAPSSITGLDLSRRYWEAYGKPLLDGRYSRFRDRIAVGLAGHGSECYGFDDDISHDHDFGPGFCLWLTAEDYAVIGADLQHDYEGLPESFMGFGPRVRTPRAQGQGRRVGVFEIGDFFESLTGLREAPSADKPHEWLMLDEPTLAAATNGRVFRDPYGMFSRTRRGFMLMPDDVRLSLISRRLGMMAQSGQYNLPRMLERGDPAGAWLSIGQFVDATSSLVFLLNNPASVGYLPYYKWRFAALRRLSKRMGSVLPQVAAGLEDIMRLSSAACYAGVGFGEGGKGASTSMAAVRKHVENICADVASELRREGLSESTETFLEWQRPYVESRITSDSPLLRSLED